MVNFIKEIPVNEIYENPNFLAKKKNEGGQFYISNPIKQNSENLDFSPQSEVGSILLKKFLFKSIQKKVLKTSHFYPKLPPDL